MIIDARELPSESLIDADICIVGGGPAGLTLATELEGSGAKVVLLESGGHELDTATQDLARGDVVGETYWSLETSRLRYFGGSSNHWTGWCRPLDATDFERKEWVEASGWPLSYDELVPYYGRAQRACDLGPFDYDASRWTTQLKLPLLDVDPKRLSSTVWQFSPPTRFGPKHRAALQDSASTTVYLFANALELVADPGRRRVGHVLAATLSGARLRVRAQQFVLATGGIENARLLLASNSEHRAGLGNEHDLVGRFFLEHPHSAVGVLLARSDSDVLTLYHSFVPVPGAAPPSVRLTLALPAAVQRRERLLNGNVSLEPLLRPPTYAASEADGATELARQLQGVRLGRSLQLFMRSEQLPSADSRVTLSRRRDALGSPLPALNWRHHPATLRSMRRTVELVAEALARAGVGRVYSYIHADRSPSETAVWPELSGGHHHMGTTRMHEDPRCGVVDRDCKLFSMDNVYVAGSSVFPTGGYANPTLTLVALACRLAETLRGRLA